MSRIPAAFWILLLLMFRGGTAGAQQFRGWNEERTPEFFIRKFIQSADTNGLGQALQAINRNRMLLTREMVMLLHKAEKLSEKRYTAYTGSIYSLLTTYYLREDNRPKYLEYLLREYNRVSQTHRQKEMMWLLVDIGNLFLIEHDDKQAGDFYKEAELIAHKIKDQHTLNVLYLNYGLIAENENQYADALAWYRKAAALKHPEGASDMTAMNYACIAGVYSLLAVPDSVLRYNRLAEQRYTSMDAEDREFYEDIPSIVNRTYADYYMLTGRSELALEYIRKAKEYARDLQIDYEYQENVYHEADLLYRMKRYEEGIRLLQQILTFNERKHLFSEQKRTWQQIAEGYMQLKDYRQAAEAFANYRQVNDSLEKIAYNSQLNLMRTMTRAYRQDMQLSEARKIIGMNELRDQQRNREMMISYIALALLLGLCSTLLVFYIKIRKNKKKLEVMHSQLLRQNNRIAENALELERSNEIRDRLFTVIAHDLRTPLNRLLVEVSLLEKTLPDQAASNATHTLKETIGLFESLLLWSKMEDKTTIYSPVKTDTGEQLRKILRFFESEARTRDITLISPEEHYDVYADPNIFQTVLRNIVSNAMSAVGGPGTIFISQQRISSEILELVISDNGPGFPEETIRKFYSGEENTPEETNGFGLMLCKVLARISKWKIDIFNNENGAGVSISMPLYKQRDQQQVKAADELVLPETWKQKLSPLLAYKHYQTSEIRRFIRSLGNITDEDTRQWTIHLEVAVHEANAGNFRKLLEMIDIPAAS